MQGDVIVPSSFVPCEPPYQVIYSKGRLGRQIGVLLITTQQGSSFIVNSFPVVSRVRKPNNDERDSWRKVLTGQVSNGKRKETRFADIEVWNDVRQQDAMTLSLDTVQSWTWEEFIGIKGHIIFKDSGRQSYFSLVRAFRFIGILTQWPTNDFTSEYVIKLRFHPNADYDPETGELTQIGYIVTEDDSLFPMWSSWPVDKDYSYYDPETGESDFGFIDGMDTCIQNIQKQIRCYMLGLKYCVCPETESPKIDGKFISVKFESATEDCSDDMNRLVERLNADKLLLTWRIGNGKYIPSLDDKKKAFAVAVKEMMDKKEGEEYIFCKDCQWIAVRRIAIDHKLNGEGQHKEFINLMEELELTQLRYKFKKDSITRNIGIDRTYHDYHSISFDDWVSTIDDKRQNSPFNSMYDVASAVNDRMEEILMKIEIAKES